jgi:hypothetical protein
MKRISVFLAALAFALNFGISSAFAQRGGGQGGGPPSGAGSGPGTGRTDMGSSMDRGSPMGGSRGNAPTGNSTMGSETVSHSSPTTVLSSNTKLASTLQTRLGSLLPTGTSLTDAASGFKNLGQFIAALHVSHNLGIPFEDLKTKMTSGDSLGKAIKELKPDANGKTEAKKANRQAKEDIQEAKS